MRIGICLQPERIKLLKPGLAEYAELSLSMLYKMSESDIKEMGKAIEDLGIKAETSNGFLPGDEVMMCGENYKREKIVEYTKKAFDKAAILGIDTFVLGSSKARFIKPEDDFSECMKQIEESSVAIGDIAREYGVNVVIEPLNKRETNTVNKVSEGAELVRKLNHPNIMLLADFFHWGVEEEPASAIYENGDILRHVHIANPITRFTPKPDDGYDYKPLKEALDKAGYDGRISLEAIYAEDYTADTSVSLPFIKSIFK
jgi:sugar phosphate isomerase/epimerase